MLTLEINMKATIFISNGVCQMLSDVCPILTRRGRNIRISSSPTDNTLQYLSNLTFEIMAIQGLRGGENGLLGYIRRTTTLLRLEGY